jgi:glucosamine-6-phosphate deaminase
MDSQPAGSAFDYSLAPFITFRDQDACRRAREIPRERLTDHPNPEFKIRIIDEPGDFYHAFATDLVGRIREARDAGRRFVALLPV